jgi:hypothetical protein
MSRHVPRKNRWARHGPAELRSADGMTVRFFKGAWWAEVAYRLQRDDGSGPTAWAAHSDRLGPYKRPRNAMVEAERHAILLRNRHGDRVAFG